MEETGNDKVNLESVVFKKPLRQTLRQQEAEINKGLDLKALEMLLVSKDMGGCRVWFWENKHNMRREQKTEPWERKNNMERVDRGRRTSKDY